MQDRAQSISTTLNPALSSEVFAAGKKFGLGAPMMVDGVMAKAFWLAVIALGASLWSWYETLNAMGYPFDLHAVPGYLGPTSLQFLSALGSFVLALTMILFHTLSPYLVPLFAFSLGVALGAFAGNMELLLPGAVMQLVLTFFGSLFASGLLHSREKAYGLFFSALIVGGLGLGFTQVLALVLNVLGRNLPFLYQNSLPVLAFILAFAWLSSLCVTADLNVLYQGQANKAPKYLEWYGVFSLFLGLVWTPIGAFIVLLGLSQRTSERN